MEMAIKHDIILYMKAYRSYTTPDQGASGRSYRRPVLHWLLSLVLLGAVGFAGCRPSDTPPVLPIALTPTAITTANQPSSEPDVSSVITTQERQLVVWVPEFFQTQETSPVAVLQTVYDQFRHNHPGVHLEIQVKAESGDASLYTYLRYAQSMAPTILPDVVLLDTEQLWQVAELGLVQPVDWNGLPYTNDFFQFARTAATYHGQTIGIPYAADVLHLVYRTNQIAQAPVTWEALMAAGLPYFFAAGKRDYPNESLLLQYVGAGGQLFEDGAVSNPEALTALFAFLVQAKAATILSDEVLELKSFNDTWSRFANQNSGFADTSAHLILAQQDAVANVGFAQIPTINGAAITIAHTWAFALLTPLPEQQQLALEFIGQLLEPTVHSAWSRTTMQLPTQLSAYDSALDASPYHEFLQRQLDVAIAIPNGPYFADFARRLQQAQESVLLNQLTVEDAVKFVQSAP